MAGLVDYQSADQSFKFQRKLLWSRTLKEQKNLAI